MMMVQYMLDRDWTLTVPGVDEVRNEFAKPTEPIELGPAAGARRHRPDRGAVPRGPRRG